MIGLVFDLLITGVFTALGYLAAKKYLWSYIVGMVLFGLDTLVFLIGPDWIGIIFHLLVIYWIFQGFNACSKFVALQQETEQQRAAAENVPTDPVPSTEST